MNRKIKFSLPLLSLLCVIATPRLQAMQTDSPNGSALDGLGAEGIHIKEGFSQFKQVTALAASGIMTSHVDASSGTDASPKRECVMRSGPWGTEGPVKVVYAENKLTVEYIKRPSENFEAKAVNQTYDQQQVKQDELLGYIVSRAGVRLDRVRKVDLFYANLDDDGGSIGIMDIEVNSVPVSTERRAYYTSMGGIGVVRCVH